MARDLHDGIGQVLGFLNVQAQSATDSVQAGDRDSATQLLSRMTEVAQEAHDDVRGYILGLKETSPGQSDQNFVALLERYCQHLSRNFDFQVRLHLPTNLPPMLIARTLENQLLYMIREALSNARAHSGEKDADVTLVRGQNNWDKSNDLLRDTFSDYTLADACKLCRRLCCMVRSLISSRLFKTSFCLPKYISAGVRLSRDSW